jgi:hypothetical protein
MKRYIKIVAVFIVFSVAAISCKAPCGCGGYGYMDLDQVDNQDEQRA